MNVLLFFPCFPSIGGTEGVMTYIANGLHRRGYGVYICSCSQTIEKTFPALDEGVELLKLPSEDIACKENIEALSKSLNSHDIRLVINNFSLKGGVGLCHAACAKAGAKLFTIHHGNIYYLDSRQLVQKMHGCKRVFYQLLFPLYKVFKNVQIYLRHLNNINHSDLYVLLAESYLHHFKGHKKVTFVNNALSYPIDPTVSFQQKEKTILYVGRIENQMKRISMSLDIWKIASQTHPDWKYVIVGDGPDKQMLIDYVDKQGIKNVEFVGFQPPLEYYKQASIFMMTSAWEGWGLTLNEAKQNKCVPVVMDTFEAVHEIITDGEDGFIVENKDIETFSERVMLLMDNTDRCQQMAEAGFLSAQKFSQDNIMNRWVQLINTYVS